MFPLRELQDLCAGASGLLGSLATMWSAVNGSPISGPLPHRWHRVALSRINFAIRLYSGDRYRVRDAFLIFSFSAASVARVVAWRRQ